MTASHEELSQAIVAARSENVPIDEIRLAYQTFAKITFVNGMAQLMDRSGDDVIAWLATQNATDLQTDLSAGYFNTAIGFATKKEHGESAATGIFVEAMYGFMRSVGKYSREFLNGALIAVTLMADHGNAADLSRTYKDIFTADLNHHWLAMYSDAGAELCALYGWHVWTVDKDPRRARVIAEPCLKRMRTLAENQLVAENGNFKVVHRYGQALLAASYVSLDAPADVADSILDGRVEQAQDLYRRAEAKLAEKYGADSAPAKAMAAARVAAAFVRYWPTNAWVWHDSRHRFHGPMATTTA
ncbi:hypothetical protein A5643_10025 [Mycobacterium sp. 1274756.6]|nr:hypothetical protein A5643_10025 [Mycobacterium sp. 1274756.6]